MFRRLVFCLLALLLAGCGSSNDFSQPSGAIQTTNQPFPYVIEASSGRLLVTGERAFFQLDDVTSPILIGEGGEGGQVTLEEFVQAPVLSALEPREATLTYRVGGAEKSMSFILTRALLPFQGSMSFTGTEKSSATLLAQQAQQARQDETFNSARLLVGGPVKLTSDTAVIWAQCPVGANVHVVSQDSRVYHDSNTTSTGSDYIDIPVGRGGSSYKVTVSQAGSVDCSTTITMDSGETQPVEVTTLVPNGKSAGTITVHVQFDDLFNTNANNNAVSIYSSSVTGPDQPFYVYTTLTNDDGVVSFSGVPNGVTFDIDAVGDDNSFTGTSGQTGETVEVTVPGHF